MTTPDIAAIAGKLTKAQRELLIEEDSSVRSYRPAQKLVAMGLWKDEGDAYVIRATLTPLGLRVREYLLRGEG